MKCILIIIFLLIYFSIVSKIEVFIKNFLIILAFFVKQKNNLFYNFQVISYIFIYELSELKLFLIKPTQIESKSC